ncbi:MAG: alanine--glyoxylate aminotransferase family protein [Candidatus Omnitrophica bacterium]|nr:alanine--glyoxylate aminotransferase family protein [Candidatus Omnitrophota bacterium]
MEPNLLLTPGPTIILDQAREALGRPIIHHRTPQFQENIKECIEGLKYVFQTKNEIYLLTCSGTGAMEAAVCNLLSPGDKAITVEAGKFGERWTELCHAFKAKPSVIEVEWGKAVQPDQIQKLLQANPDVKAVFVTLSETSTGVVTDIKVIGEIVKKTNAVLVVDAISGLGVIDCQTDNWNIDVLVSATHKGFMLPPGLAFVSVSDKAYKLVEASTNCRYYLDLRESKKAFAATDTPYTPAIGIVIGLVESLKWIRAKGIENLFAHYSKLAEGTRAAAKALGLKLLAKENCISDVLTAIYLPESIDSTKLVKKMRDTYGVTCAAGQGKLNNRIIRIAHMGCVEEKHIIKGLEIFEKVLAEMGHTFKPNAGVNAAKEVFNYKEVDV